MYILRAKVYNIYHITKKILNFFLYPLFLGTGYSHTKTAADTLVCTGGRS